MASTHPLDPLSAGEIQSAISIVRAAHKNVNFHVVSLHEPRKAAMTKWLANRSASTKPPRVADVSVVAPGGKVGDGHVDLAKKQIVHWEWVNGRQPIVSFSNILYCGGKVTHNLRADHRGGAAKG